MELSAIARAVIDANMYMTVGTADAAGVPWVSPVYFAHDRYRQFYWASTTSTRHSHNLAVRSDLSLVIFDSQVPVYQGRAVYVAGTGEEVTGAALDAGIEVYNRPAAARNASTLIRADVEGAASYRLYRATATDLYTLDPSGHDLRVPIDL